MTTAGTFRTYALCLLPFALTLAGCSKPSAEEHFKKATALMEQSRLPEAIIEYKVALQADATRGDIRLLLADAYAKVPDWPAALKEYVRAADQLPNNATAQIRAGSLLLLARRFEDAKTRAEKAIAIDPKNAEAQILMGNTLAQLKDLDGAIAEYQQAIALDPAGEAAYANIGVVQLARGNKEEAEKSFRKGIDVAPKSVQARLALANFLWANQRVPEAEQVLKDALAIDPANLSANRALGVFYLASNRAKDAEPYFQAIAKASKTTAATVSLADYYVAMKRYDDARSVLTELAKNDDANAIAQTRMAALDAIQGQKAEAYAKLHDVLGKHPKESPARLLNARLLASDGKMEDALAEASLIVTQDPNGPVSAEAFLLIGAAQTALNHPEDAVKAYEEVLRRQSQPMQATVALAALSMKAGQLDKASNYVKQALAIQPRNPLARSMMVRLLIAQGNTAKAKEEIAALQKEYPNSPTVMNLLAAEQMRDKQYEAARASYAKVLAASPNDFEAVTGMTTLDVAAGRTKEAIARMEAGLTKPQPSGELLVLAARVYAASGNAAKTEELLKKAIETQPDRLDAYEMLGSFYLRQHRLQEAKAQFEEVVKRNPKSVPANTMLGMLLESDEKPKDAEKQYQKVLSLDANAAVANNNLAWIYAAANKNLDEALQMAKAAQQALPDEPHVLDTLGWIYYRKDLPTQAVQALEASVKKDATDPTSHYHLGMAYYQMGDMEKAKVSLQRALSFKKDFDGASDARKTLAAIGR
jgi:tetratricopeptide (TPR) repeat protein